MESVERSGDDYRKSNGTIRKKKETKICFKMLFSLFRKINKGKNETQTILMDVASWYQNDKDYQNIKKLSKGQDHQRVRKKDRPDDAKEEKFV